VNGVRPSLMPRFDAAGIQLPQNLFEERILMEA
jgi:hypothetical protein